MTTNNILILTWTVRGFNTRQSDLRTDILKQRGHIVILQEIMMWLNVDRERPWRVVGGESIKHGINNQTKGKRGGLAVVISLELEFTDLHKSAIDAHFEEMKGTTLKSVHVEEVTLNNAEAEIPDGEVDIEQSLALDTGTVSGALSTPAAGKSTQTT